jgi:hypothetical protein
MAGGRVTDKGAREKPTHSLFRTLTNHRFMGLGGLWLQRIFLLALFLKFPLLLFQFD